MIPTTMKDLTGTAYVLLSGGVDSTTCLYHAIRNYDRVVAVSMLYGQRHEKEVDCAVQIAHLAGVEHRIIDISKIIGIGGLTDKNLVIPPVSYAELPHGVSPTYVPFRNGLLLAILTSQAAADPDATAVFIGAHAEDAENDAYPDCSADFASVMGAAISKGTYGNITLQAPLIHLKKYQVVEMGEGYNVPWHWTWSCYEGGEAHCGVCPTCRARKEAFQLAGVVDPTRYMDEVI